MSGNCLPVAPQKKSSSPVTRGRTAKRFPEGQTAGYAPLLPAAPHSFLAGGRPGPAFPGFPAKQAEGTTFLNGIKPAQVAPVIPIAVAGVVAVAGAEIRAAGYIPSPPSPAGVDRRGFRLGGPLSRGKEPRARGTGGRHSLPVISPYRPDAGSPVNLPVDGSAFVGIRCSGGSLTEASVVGKAGVIRAKVGANQGAGLTILTRIRIRTIIRGRRAAANANPFDPLGAPPFLFGKLKDAVDADPGNARFPVGQPALLGGDKAPELAAFAEIDRIIPLVAVFAGRPGFLLGKGIRLVDAAVEGFAPVFGQGFQDGGRAVGMGKGLPVGTVPGDGAGLGRWIPPPLRKMLLERQGRPLHCVGTWLFPPV